MAFKIAEAFVELTARSVGLAGAIQSELKNALANAKAGAIRGALTGGVGGAIGGGLVGGVHGAIQGLQTGGVAGAVVGGAAGALAGPAGVEIGAAIVGFVSGAVRDGLGKTGRVASETLAKSKELLDLSIGRFFVPLSVKISGFFQKLADALDKVPMEPFFRAAETVGMVLNSLIPLFVNLSERMADLVDTLSRTTNTVTNILTLGGARREALAEERKMREEEETEAQRSITGIPKLLKLLWKDFWEDYDEETKIIQARKHDRTKLAPLYQPSFHNFEEFGRQLQLAALRGPLDAENERRQQQALIYAQQTADNTGKLVNKDGAVGR
jgi:hypothetical protein